MSNCCINFCECLGLNQNHFPPSVNKNNIVDNELTRVEKYSLILECQVPENTNFNDFNAELQEFAQTIVNREEFGEVNKAVFYKAHIYNRVHNNEMNHRYTFHFYLYSAIFWNIQIHDKVCISLQEVLARLNVGIVDISYVVNELIHNVKRMPFTENEAQDDQDGNQIPGNCCEKFLKFWLIVPSVQWKFFGLLYQMYTFDIFHQGFISKFVHFFTIPTNVMLSMCFLAQFSFFGIRTGHGAFTVNGGLILMIILVVLYLIMGINAKSIPWGFATSIVIFVCWLTGNLWYAGHSTPTNPWYNPTTWATNPIIWSYGMSFIQALSHVSTGSLPPYITGYGHWESFHTFYCKKHNNNEKRCTNICFIILSSLAFPVFSVAVAWFSWPHLIGTEIIYIMAGIGYQPGFFKQFRIICEKAESTGDPGIADFPCHPDQLINNSKYEPFVRNLINHRLISNNATKKEIMECAATCNMLTKSNYFKHGNQHIDKDMVNHYNLISKGMQKMPRRRYSPA